MTASMTGFAARNGALGALNWAWEIRSVNGRGFDLRLRLPDGVEGLEAALRAALAPVVARGSVTLTLRLGREEAGEAPVLDQAALDATLTLLDAVQTRALEMGVTLAQPDAADVLAQRGVLKSRAEVEAAPPLPALMEDFAALLDEYRAMRAGEGAVLGEVIAGQLARIAVLADEATEAALARSGEQRAALQAQIARLIEAAEGLDEPRLLSELALIAVKSDITEEIDRLRAHVGAARALLEETAPAGRRLDFLAQEFNREANTLCSKAGNARLTGIGLELKAVIDQMREQIQNVE